MASRRVGVVAGVAAIALAFSLSSDRIIAANTGDRTLSLYHIHTKETLTVTYKKNGQYVPEAMKQIDWIMRDWRKNQTVRMDPAAIDLIWEMYTELGAREPAQIICGYRSHGTNQMLRRKVGGQASQSQHMTGKAIDIAFPDVPLKRMRYSALVRERGGVGYYPTSGIPFVHVDTARVRAWPRLPRYELALLFPGGQTRHAPAGGGSITRDDVRVARSKHQDLATQIAAFHNDRQSGVPAIQVASAERAPEPAAKRGFSVASLTDALPWSKKSAPPKQPVVTWEAIPEAEQRDSANKQVAALAPEASPKLVAQPKLIERPSHFKPRPSDADRSKLAALVAKTQSEPMPKLIDAPKPAVRPSKALAQAAMPDAAPAPKGAQVAALIPETPADTVTDVSPDSLGNGWVQAPEFDEDHPDELAYRPFPLAPLLTETASAQDPQFAGLQHPDVGKTLELLDAEGAIQPMKFRPGQQVAQVLWAQQFQGNAVHLDALKELDQGRIASGIENRSVKTSAR